MSSLALQAYDIRADDRSLRMISKSGERAAEHFERLRTEYSFRPEFSNFRVALEEKSDLAPACKALGFAVENEVRS